MQLAARRHSITIAFLLIALNELHVSVAFAANINKLVADNAKRTDTKEEAYLQRNDGHWRDVPCWRSKWAA